MENQSSSELSAEDYRRHVENSKQFAGTAAEYCKEHELSQKRFSYYKTASKKESSEFAKVKAVGSKSEVNSKKLNHLEKNLSDPKWLATFLCEIVKKL